MDASARARVVLLQAIIREGAMGDGDELTEAEIDEWYRIATAYDPERNIGAQVRDRKIRKLIEALRLERERARRAAD
jgi:hypothetical protein